MQLGKNQIVTTAKTVVLPFFYDLQIGKPLGGKMLAQQRNRIIRGTIVHNKKAACYPLCALEKKFPPLSGRIFDYYALQYSQTLYILPYVVIVPFTRTNGSFSPPCKQTKNDLSPFQFSSLFSPWRESR